MPWKHGRGPRPSDAVSANILIPTTGRVSYGNWVRSSRWGGVDGCTTCRHAPQMFRMRSASAVLRSLDVRRALTHGFEALKRFLAPMLVGGALMTFLDGGCNSGFNLPTDSSEDPRLTGMPSSSSSAQRKAAPPSRARSPTTSLRKSASQTS